MKINKNKKAFALILLLAFCFFVNMNIFDVQEESRIVSIDTIVEDVCTENGIEVFEKKNLNPSNYAECLDLDDFIYTLKKNGIQRVYVCASCPDPGGITGSIWKKNYNAWTENGTYTYKTGNSVSYKEGFVYSELEKINYSEIVFSRNVLKKKSFLFLLAIIEVAAINSLYPYLLDKYKRRKAINGT